MMEKKKWVRLVDSGKDWLHLARVAIIPGRVTRLHTHDFAEVFFVDRGQGIHGINGERKKLEAGDLIFIRPEDEHILLPSDKEGFVLVNLAFPASVLDDLLARHEGLRRFHDSDSRLPVRIHLSGSELRLVQDEVSLLGRAGTGRLFLEKCLLNIYALLTPAAGDAAPMLPSWLERACAEIQRPENFAAGTPAFFRLAGRNAEYVARTTRQFMGVTPTDYVNRIRMDFAARELRLGGKPIIEIALECGINNLSHFYVLFRRFHHVTPRYYRIASQSPAT